MSSKEILKEFMLTSAPSGYESEMAYKLKAHLEQYCPEVTLDRVGNVIAKVTGTDPSLPRAMIFGHMDQLGFIVRKVEEDGFIQVDRLGGDPGKGATRAGAGDPQRGWQMASRRLRSQGTPRHPRGREIQGGSGYVPLHRRGSIQRPGGPRHGDLCRLPGGL